VSAARLLALPALLAVAGCAASGSYSSLGLRAAELGLPGGSAPVGCPVPRDAAAAVRPGEALVSAPPSDPAYLGRINALVTEARAGQTQFEGLLPAAQASAARAGAPGSDAWIAAQQDVSRLEAARGRTVQALSELDALGVQPAQGGPVSPADYAALLEAADQVRAITEAQDAAIDAISDQLGSVTS
jgi:hypothetical protein